MTLVRIIILAAKPTSQTGQITETTCNSKPQNPNIDSWFALQLSCKLGTQ